MRRGEARRADVIVRHDLERRIRQRLPDRLGALTERAGFARLTGDPEILAQVDRHPPKTPRVIERPGQPVGVTKTGQHRLQLSDREKRITKLEAKIDGKLERLAGLGKM